MEAKDNNGRLEIELPSSLDLPAASELRDALLDALARDSGADLVLGATAVDRVSTAAVQVMVAAAGGYAGAARRLVIDGSSEALAAAFRHLGLASEFEKMTTI